MIWRAVVDDGLEDERTSLRGKGWVLRYLSSADFPFFEIGSARGNEML